jgi:hypothetical protein
MIETESHFENLIIGKFEFVSNIRISNIRTFLQGFKHFYYFICQRDIFVIGHALGSDD